MVCCCVACYNLRTPGDRSLSFHRFPHSRPDILEKWIQATCRKNWRPTKNNRICSAHFTEECFLTKVADERNKLKEDAVPSLFDYSFYYVENDKPAKKKRRDPDKIKKEIKKSIPPQPDPVQLKIEEMLDFIEEYKKYPVLWHTGHNIYISREIKRDALRDIGKKYGFSPQTVLNKIHNLRSYFRREHAKVLKTKFESSPIDRYEPSWFAYKPLLFILDGKDAIEEMDTMAALEESLVLEQRESLNSDSQNQRLHEKDQQTPLSSLNCVSQNQKLHERNQQIPLSSLKCDSQNQNLHERNQQIPLSSMKCDSQNQILHERNQQIPLSSLNCDSQNQRLERDEQIPLLYLDCDSENQKLNEMDQRTPSSNCDSISRKEESTSLSYSNRSRKTYSRYRGNNHHPWTDHNYFQHHKNVLQKKSMDNDSVTSENQRCLQRNQQSLSSSLNCKITLNKEESLNQSYSCLRGKTYSHCKENNRQWTNHIYLEKDAQHDKNVFAATLAESDNIESEVMDMKPDNIPDPIACTTDFNPYLSYFADDDLKDPLACDIIDMDMKQEIKEEPPDDDVQIAEGISLDMFATELDEEMFKFMNLNSTEFPRDADVFDGTKFAGNLRVIDGAIKPEEIFDDSEVSGIQGIINGAGMFTVKPEVFDCTGFIRNSGAVGRSPGVIDGDEVASSLCCRSW